MKPAPFFDSDELRRDPHLQTVEAVAASSGVGPLYLVGGYLRDLLLGRSRARRIDLDLVIWGQPERFGRDLVAALEGSIIRLDPEAVRAIVRSPLKACGDRSAGVIVQIDISRPKGKTIEDDLAARDFTVNAMAVRLDTPDTRHPAPCL